jgi:hypothetical protein
MSTISLSYPDVTRTQRVPVLGKILILISLVVLMISILILAVSASTGEPTGQAPVSQTAIIPSAVPVPAPSSMEMQSGLSITPGLSSEERNEPSVLPVPVPTPPEQ